MTLDPNGCTFWYTNEYYAVDGLNDLTRIGSFAFPDVHPLGAGGTLSGTVTATAGGAPISGATVTLGSRTTTTNGSGFYSFASVPAGTYPTVTASAPGFNSATATSIVVTDGNTTTRDFSLGTAPTSACPTDTTQADFQTRRADERRSRRRAPATSSCSNAAHIDQQNTTVTQQRLRLHATSWAGQTFTPASTGQAHAGRPQSVLHAAARARRRTSRSRSEPRPEARPAHGRRSRHRDDPRLQQRRGRLLHGDLRQPRHAHGGDAVRDRAPRGVESVGRNVRLRLQLRVPGQQPVRQRAARHLGQQRLDLGGRRDERWSRTWLRDVHEDRLRGVRHFVSSTKDGNPAPGFTTNWTTLSWTAATPANTTLRFQVAGEQLGFRSLQLRRSRRHRCDVLHDERRVPQPVRRQPLPRIQSLPLDDQRAPRLRRSTT